jgi:voltage-gated potassium channel
MALVLGGVFTMFSAASAGIKAIVGGELQGYLGRQRMERTLQNLKDHIIVCGHGRMGRRVCREIAASGATVVVIDASEGAFADLEGTRILSMIGDATSDELLRTAGIDRARALISVVPKDADNLYITMSARLLNEKIFIVARAEGSDAEQKLSRAGANRVVAPYVIGGDRVVQAVLRPAVLDFIDLATRSQHLELQLEEALVHAGSKLAGRTLEATRIGVDLELIVVAIQEADGKMKFNPASTRVVVPGERLLVLGHRHNLDKLGALARA